MISMVWNIFAITVSAITKTAFSAVAATSFVSSLALGSFLGSVASNSDYLDRISRSISNLIDNTHQPRTLCNTKFFSTETCNAIHSTGSALQWAISGFFTMLIASSPLLIQNYMNSKNNEAIERREKQLKYGIQYMIDKISDIDDRRAEKIRDLLIEYHTKNSTLDPEGQVKMILECVKIFKSDKDITSKAELSKLSSKDRAEILSNILPINEDIYNEVRKNLLIDQNEPREINRSMDILRLGNVKNGFNNSAANRELALVA